MNASAFVVATYQETFRQCSGSATSLGSDVSVPIFSESLLTQLCSEVRRVNGFDQAMIQVDADVIIVGDLHGNLHNLFLIFEKFGYPPKSKYLFLGNIIDFGEYSLELITLIFALAVQYPNSVYVLRGNSESNAIPVYRGMQSDIVLTYRSKALFEKFAEAFQILPFACLVNRIILCCQPNVVQDYESIQQLYRLRASMKIPRENDAYLKFISDYGHMNEDKIQSFLDKSNLLLLITGSANEDDQCVTQIGGALSLSSCETDNYACVLPIYLNSNEVKPEIFETTQHPVRNEALFKKVADPPTTRRPHITIPRIKSLSIDTLPLHLQGSFQQHKSLMTFHDSNLIVTNKE